MPAVLTFYGENYIADLLFGQAQPAPPNWYLALCTLPPDPSVDGTSISEPPTSAGYARVEVPNNAVYWGPASGGIVVNNQEIDFGMATADWPSTITDYAFCDSLTGGNVYMTGSLRVPRVVFDGDKVTFGVGQVMVSVNPIEQIITTSS